MGEDQLDLDALVQQLNSQCKDGDMGRISLRQAFFLLDEDKEPVPYEGRNGRMGLRQFLEAMGEYWPQACADSQGNPCCCHRLNSSVLLGSAGQVVFAANPTLNLGDIQSEYANFLFRMGTILKPVDYSLAAVGYNPYAALDQLEAAPWAAEAPDLTTGHAGLSVTLEYANQEDALLKLQVASLLAPVFSFMASNSAVVEGGPAASPVSYLAHRCEEPVPCFAQGLFQGTASFQGYLQANPGFSAQVVSLDKGLTISVADSLPKGPALAYAALLKGLFYSPTNLELLAHFLKLDGLACPWDDSTAAASVSAIASQGTQAQLYGRGLDSWVDLLFRLAAEGLGTESALLEDLQEFMAF